MTRKTIQVDSETHRQLRMISAEHQVPVFHLIRGMVQDCNVVHVVDTIKSENNEENSEV